MSGLLRAFAKPVVERRLGRQPKIAGDDGFKGRSVPLAAPFKLPGIDAVAQDLVDGGLVNRPAARQVLLMSDDGKLLDGVLARGAQFIEAAHQGRQGRVRNNRALAVRPVGIQIADGSIGGPDSLACLLDHAFARLFAKVVDEVFRHQNLDAVDELLGGARLVPDDGSFLNEMNLKALDFVDCDPVTEVAVEAVGFLEQQNPAVCVLAKVSHNRIEAGTASALRGFDIGEGGGNVESLLFAVASKQLVLRGNREALFRLFLRGNAGIEDCLPGRRRLTLLEGYVFFAGLHRVSHDPLDPIVPAKR